MFKEKMEQLRKLIAEKEARSAEYATEVRTLLEGNKLEEARAKKAERDTLEGELAEARSDLAMFEEQEAGKPAVEPRKAQQKPQDEYRTALDTFIRSKGQKVDGLQVRDGEIVVPAKYLRDATGGVVSADVAATIPESIVYNPAMEVHSMTDLKPMVQVFKATTGSGTYPILKKATARLASVAELAINPALAKPEFLDVPWKVVTYRGALPISNESIQDSTIDLVGIIARHANEQKTNTTNFAIATKLKAFTAKPMGTLDDLKAIVNVALDPAYVKSLVASQSFYNVLDTLKDANGRYLLQDSIVSPSGKMLLGMPVFVVEDTLVGEAGNTTAFIGDLKRAIVFADRVDVTVRWVDDTVYGQFLQVATRFDAVAADTNAGFFVTYTAPVVTAPVTAPVTEPETTPEG